MRATARSLRSPRIDGVVQEIDDQVDDGTNTSAMKHRYAAITGMSGDRRTG